MLGFLRNVCEVILVHWFRGNIYLGLDTPSSSPSYSHHDFTFAAAPSFLWLQGHKPASQRLGLAWIFNVGRTSFHLDDLETRSVGIMELAREGLRKIVYSPGMLTCMNA